MGAPGVEALEPDVGRSPQPRLVERWEKAFDQKTILPLLGPEVEIETSVDKAIRHIMIHRIDPSH